MVDGWHRLSRRIWNKGVALVPVMVLAGIVFVGLALLARVLVPYLPAPYQTVLAQLQGGEWMASRASLEHLFNSYGSAKYVAFLAVQIMQVLFAPIPGQLIGLLGGYLFGFWQGLLLTMLGLTLGSLIAIAIGRWLGQQIVRKLIPSTVVDKFDYLVEAGGLWTFFMLFLLPGLPDDALCFIAGLTRLRIWHLVLVCVLGRLPGMAVLTFVGASTGSGTLANIVLGIGLGAACVLWLFSEEVEAFFTRLGTQSRLAR